ncbi:MAG: hypothetical protein ACFFCM_06900 [Promethearchaeota archaeon]
MNSKFMKISKFASYYERMILSFYISNNLQNNWLDALYFFFHCVFFGGRRDNLSKVYKEHAFEIIKKFTIQGKKLDNDIIEEIDNKLNEKTSSDYKFPDKDKKMVNEILTKLQEIPNYNIVNYTLQYLRKWNPEDINIINEEIEKIHGIGRKKTTLFFRDLADINHLEEQEPEGFDKYQKEQIYKYFQPIDVWVSRVASHLGINNNLKADDKALHIVRKCFELREKVSPIKFNQGAWIMGWICGQVVSIENAINNLDQMERIMELYLEVRKS